MSGVLVELEDLSTLDADGIYRKLRDTGIKGRRGRPDRCPLANYLRKVSSLDFVTVGGFTMSYTYTKQDRTRIAGLPKSAREFVARFDSGSYPALNERVVSDPLRNMDREEW